MRDHERILRILARLSLLWQKMPELRLAQLIGNVYDPTDYYVEDEEFITTLEHFYEPINAEIARTRAVKAESGKRLKGRSRKPKL